jgi:hypothetical protein
MSTSIWTSFKSWQLFFIFCQFNYYQYEYGDKVGVCWFCRVKFYTATTSTREKRKQLVETSEADAAGRALRGVRLALPAHRACQILLATSSAQVWWGGQMGMARSAVWSQSLS